MVSSSNMINCHNPNSIREHHPSVILDFILFIVIICSASFLVYSCVSYLFTVFSLLQPSFSITHILFVVLYYTSVFISVLFFITLFCIYWNPRLRVCEKEGCLGMWKCRKHDLKYHDEETLIMGQRNGAFKEFDELPNIGSIETNQDYESIREQLRQVAPVNGRAVVIFRRRCGCAYAKLEGWGPKDVRHPKKSTGNRR